MPEPAIDFLCPPRDVNFLKQGGFLPSMTFDVPVDYFPVVVNPELYD